MNPVETQTPASAPRPMADSRLRRPFEQLELAIERWTVEAKLAS